MQQVFAQLGYDQHIALYKQAAFQALRAYDLLGGAVRLEPVTFVNHATFKVTISTLGRPIRQFALHIYRPGVRDTAQITAELRWLVALHAETALKTPPPVATATGTLLNTVILPQCSEPLYCVLFEWLEGRFLHTNEQTPDLAWQVGQFTGALHRHSQHFSSANDLTCRRLDTEGIFDWAVLHRLNNAGMLFTTDHLMLFVTVADSVEAAFLAISQNTNTFGLIHTDLIWKNYFFHDQGVGAVDFEGCAWGYYLYDLAPTLLGYRDEPAYPALRDALIAGYRTIQPFPTSHERHLNTLIAARHVVSCCWLAHHLDHPDLRKRAADIVQHRTTAIRSLLEDTG
jgi:Ser/Thr protein kinase RdoA (MazF antagonist)